MGDVSQLFTAAEICPKILPEPPKKKLGVNYQGIMLEPGQTLSTRNCVSAPRITFEANPDAIYSMVMIDPDALSREKPTVAEWLHWLVTNIAASDLLHGINGGTHVIPYTQPSPQPRTGVHRYCIFLWEHEGRRVSQPKPDQRAKFKVAAFQQKHNLGAPVAGNFFLAEHAG